LTTGNCLNEFKLVEKIRREDVQEHTMMEAVILQITQGLLPPFIPNHRPIKPGRYIKEIEYHD
jgi:hypothetical protein